LRAGIVTRARYVSPLTGWRKGASDRRLANLSDFLIGGGDRLCYPKSGNPARPARFSVQRDGVPQCLRRLLTAYGFRTGVTHKYVRCGVAAVLLPI